MLRFTVQMEAHGVDFPFDIYIGEPSDQVHPLHFQIQWLRGERQIEFNQTVFENFTKLHTLAKENNVSFEELVAYALGRSEEESKKKPPVALDAKVLSITALQAHFRKAHTEASKKATVKKTKATPLGFQDKLKAARTQPGSFVRATPAKTLEFISHMALQLWPEHEEYNATYRTCFTLFALYQLESPYKPATLEALYETLTHEDPVYSAAVIMDTEGKFLSPALFRLLQQWLFQPVHYKRVTSQNIAMQIADFALNPEAGKLSGMTRLRKAMRSHLLKGSEYDAH